MEYPKYKCHKEVSAVKITGVEIGADGSLTLRLGGGFDNVVFSHEEMKRRQRPEAGWYLVQYADGFKSFSPGKTFEEGYAAVSDEGGGATTPIRTVIADVDGADDDDEDGDEDQAGILDEVAAKATG
jgi:hypothetical protein